MSAWITGLIIVAATIVVLAGLLALLTVRRRWLSREGGTFECSVQLRSTTPGTGWVLGVARYDADALLWFRFFSYASRPRKVFVRGEVRVIESRDPDAIEAVALYAGQRIVTLEDTNDDAQRWHLAMGADSLTGMMSWLEAAPPRSPSN